MLDCRTITAQEEVVQDMNNHVFYQSSDLSGRVREDDEIILA
jgi:spore coat protein CotF